MDTQWNSASLFAWSFLIVKKSIIFYLSTLRLVFTSQWWWHFAPTVHILPPLVTLACSPCRLSLPTATPADPTRRSECYCEHRKNTVLVFYHYHHYHVQHMRLPCYLFLQTIILLLQSAVAAPRAFLPRCEDCWCYFSRYSYIYIRVLRTQLYVRGYIPINIYSFAISHALSCLYHVFPTYSFFYYLPFAEFSGATYGRGLFANRMVLEIRDLELEFQDFFS